MFMISSLVSYITLYGEDEEDTMDPQRYGLSALQNILLLVDNLLK